MFELSFQCQAVSSFVPIVETTVDADGNANPPGPRFPFHPGCPSGVKLHVASSLGVNFRFVQEASYHCSHRATKMNCTKVE
jgi:hypothetical protein